MTTAADFVARWLKGRGMGEVFELSGGTIGHLLDAFARSDLRVLEMHHEQSAAFAACGLAQMRGRPAVAVAAGGPGALNLVSGIAAAFYDSVPLIAITGQVQSYLRRGDRAVRQWALQETDFHRLIAPVAKAVFTANAPGDVPRVLESAYRAAVSGRPGPAVVELPFDVQGGGVPEGIDAPTLEVEGVAPDSEEDWIGPLLASTRPLVLAGGGLRGAGGVDLFRRWIERMGVPVVATIRGLDVLPGGHPLRMGLAGIYGLRAANRAIAECDCLLVLGSRLDHGLTAGNELWLGRGRTVIQVDQDAGELGARIRRTIRVRADLRRFLSLALERGGQPPAGWNDWRRRVRALAEQHPHDEERPAHPSAIDPNRFLRRLSERSPRAVAFVADAGQHTWWAAQSLSLSEGVRFLATPGLLAMGYALPAAVGVAFGERAPVVAVIGDGGMQLQIQELQTIARAQLPVKVVVLNNRCHGLVRQFQDEHFGGRHAATVSGYDTPDFARVASAYGVEGHAIGSPAEVEDAIGALWSDPARPALLEVAIPLETAVWPFVPFGAGLSQMRPPRERR
jgi:acetolactate synthase-1/2/3 large subunit